MRKGRAVVDASCVLRALLGESEDAFRWFEGIESGEVEGLAPDLLYAEVAHGLTRQIRANRMTIEQAQDAIRTVVEYPLVTTPSRLLAPAACMVAVSKSVTAYDAHYLALAEAEDAVLVTADRALASAATRGVLLE